MCVVARVHLTASGTASHALARHHHGRRNLTARLRACRRAPFAFTLARASCFHACAHLQLSRLRAPVAFTLARTSYSHAYARLLRLSLRTPLAFTLARTSCFQALACTACSQALALGCVCATAHYRNCRSQVPARLTPHGAACRPARSSSHRPGYPEQPQRQAACSSTRFEPASRVSQRRGRQRRRPFPIGAKGGKTLFCHRHARAQQLAHQALGMTQQGRMAGVGRMQGEPDQRAVR